MDKEKIAALIEAKHSDLINWLEKQPDELWTLGPKGKWTTGQVALHILQRLIPLNNALDLPKFLLRLKYGKANRAVRDYQTVITRYQQQLEKSKAKPSKSSKHIKIPPVSDKQYIINRIQIEEKKLQYKTLKISDENLDTVILPHPITGKIPVREILMWTAYHAEYHTQILKAEYSNLNS